VQSRYYLDVVKVAVVGLARLSPLGSLYVG
jgi:hypothetical protein